MARVVIYTAVFGKKDRLSDPINYDGKDEIDYICFTDDKDLKSEVYKVVYTEPTIKDITKNARKLKINGFQGIDEYDVAIWHDASLTVIHDKFLELIPLANTYTLSTFKHPLRSCVYCEGITCIRINKDYAVRVLIQMIMISLSWMPVNYGMFETSILVKNVQRYNNDNIGKLWWFWVKNLSRRDQLSITYVTRRTKLDMGIIQGCRDTNDYSNYTKHLNTKYLDDGGLFKAQNRTTKTICMYIIRFIIIGSLFFAQLNKSLLYKKRFINEMQKP